MNATTDHGRGERAASNTPTTTNLSKTSLHIVSFHYHLQTMSLSASNAAASDIARAVSYSDDEQPNSNKAVISKKPSYDELECLSSFYKEKYHEAQSLLNSIAVSKGCVVSGKLLVEPSALTNSTIVDPQLKEALGRWQTKMALKIRAEQGDTKAMIALGRLYENGDEALRFPVNHGLAFVMYQWAAFYGDLEGIVETGNCLIWGFGTQLNVPTGINILIGAALGYNSAAAARGLGDYYKAANAERASMWYKKAEYLESESNGINLMDMIIDGCEK